MTGFALYQNCVVQLLQLSYLFRLFQNLEAACHNDQSLQCSNAVLEKRLDTFQNAGHCSRKTYAQFTHSCVISHYVPGLDYCCCSDETSQSIMCCRYHQDWKYFRCTQEEDKIHTNSSSMPLEILVPCLIILVILIPIMLIIVWKCLRSRLREHRCVVCHDNREYCHCVKRDQDGILVALPSAPPLDVATNSCRHPLHGCVQFDSYPAQACSIDRTCTNHCECTTEERCTTYPYNSRDHQSTDENSIPSRNRCTCCPPPTYEQSRDHRILDPIEHQRTDYQCEDHTVTS